MDLRALITLGAGPVSLSSPTFFDKLEQRLGHYPRCAATHYLLGCHCFDRGRRAEGVRHMMTAHHSEPALESAALLVFAGLNWGKRPETPLLPVLLDTWEEFRRPEFGRRRGEYRLLGLFAEPHDGLAGVSSLARRLWRLPIRSLRAQIREAVRSPEAAPYPLLLSPATA